MIETRSDVQEASRANAGASLSFAIVTPSYRPDFERCRLLAESVLTHVPPPVQHYILVDRCDRDLFSVLRTSRTHIVLKQDILPWWLIQVPVLRKWWLNLRGFPVRGWILQQLAKLSVNYAVDADVYVFLDSGAFFVRGYDPRSTLHGVDVPLFREQKSEVRLAWNTRWHQIAAGLLGLAPRASYDTSYVGNLIYWRRDNLVRMQQHIERVTGQAWLKPLARQLRLSEYVLYGMFVEHVLGEQSGHYFSSLDLSLNHWTEQFLDQSALTELKSKLDPNVAVVMINEKAHVSASSIRRVFLEP